MREPIGKTPAKKSAPKSDSVQAAVKESQTKKSNQQAADIWKKSQKYLDPRYFSGVGSTVSKKVEDPPTTPKNVAVVTPTPASEPVVTQPAPVTSPPQSQSVVDVLNPNVYEAYKQEVKRLTLKLVDRARYLLLAYDFSSIDSISEYRLDSDNGARQSDVISLPQVPVAPSSATLTAQESAINVMNLISNKISDNVSITEKLNLFGSTVNGVFEAKKVNISNGATSYDLRFVLEGISPEIKNIIVRCYEIS